MTVNKVAADSIISIHGKPLKEFSGKSLALFAIHSCKGALSPSQKRIAGSLAEHGFTVVIVDSAGVLNYRVLKDALNVAASYVLRKNFGRDFGSWVAFVQHAFDEMLEAKCALFVNDSVCGPLGDPKLLFERIKQCDYDVFALTDSWQGGYHLQSSLFSISHRGFRRRQIFEFFRDYAFPDVKEDVIAQGEIGFSKKLLSAPADVKVLARYDDVAREFLDRFENYVDLFGAFPWSSHEVGIVHDGKSVVSVTPSRGQHDYAMAWLQNLISNLVEGVPRNPQHVFWDVLIEKFNYQFIKRELLCHNPEKVATLMLFGIYASSWGQDFWEVLRYESMTMGSKTLPPLFKRGPLATVMSPPLPPALARKTKIAKK